MRLAAFLTFATSLALAAPAGAGPLHQAARKDGSVVIAELLASGAYVNVQDAFGNASLHRAAGFGHAAAIGALLAAGADPKIRNKQGLASRDLALEAGEEAAVAALRKTVLFSSTIRSGIYANPTCPDPDLIWIYVPDFTIRIDRVSDGDLVSIGHMKSESDPLTGGWQRFKNEYADGETFGYFLRAVHSARDEHPPRSVGGMSQRAGGGHDSHHCRSASESARVQAIRGISRCVIGTTSRIRRRTRTPGG